MYNISRVVRAGAAAVMMASLGACQSSGLGNVLGGVLGQPATQTASGTIQNVDTRYQTITLRQSNGQTINVTYDNQTQVVYNNQNYSPSNLEFGDQVTVQLQTNSNGGYYTNYVQVDAPVQNSNGGVTNGSNVQTFQGTVRQINQNNGWFTMDAGNGVMLTVQMPYRASSNDINRFNSLRSGDYVRLYGTFLSSSTVQLQQFY